jgi:malic enzyme
MTTDIDVVVIGAGSGGRAAVRQVRKQDLRTALHAIAGKSALNRPDLSACSAYKAEALD